jgi:hypothetical protein
MSITSASSTSYTVRSCSLTSCMTSTSSCVSSSDSSSSVRSIDSCISALISASLAASTFTSCAALSISSNGFIVASGSVNLPNAVPGFTCREY